LVATGMVRIIKLVDLLKTNLSSNPEAKSPFSEAITFVAGAKQSMLLLHLVHSDQYSFILEVYSICRTVLFVYYIYNVKYQNDYVIVLS
jgi:hypothetical protein